MATSKQRRNRRSTGGGGGGLPGWAMLVIGLIIGLFVAFLVYLDDLDPVATDGIVDPETDLAEQPDKEDRPRFEFYSILPELEVVIPEIPGPGDEPAVDEGAAPPPDELEPIPETGDDARFFLQAGSFRDTDTAEQLKAEITLLGLDVEVRTVRIDGDEWHRVRVGPFHDTETLQDAQQRLRTNDIDYLVLRDRG